MMISVKPVLEAFKSNTKDGKDVKKQFARIKELEKGNEDNIVTALDQLTDILCQAAFFQKAFDILKVALQDYENNCHLNEIMARICFIMEQFDQCIYYNKQAKKLCDLNDVIRQSNINSDIGLAQYRLAIQGNDKFREHAFKSCRKALELYPDNTSAMVNLGLIYKLNELIDVSHKGESEAAKLFKAAVDKDRANFPNDLRKRNPAALVNLGVI
jgi:tetratricopeptide (TPR) repeat protein